MDMSGIVAGSKYRGEFEERIKKVLQEVRAAGNILLFMMNCIQSSERAERKEQSMLPIY